MQKRTSEIETLVAREGFWNKPDEAKILFKAAHGHVGKLKPVSAGAELVAMSCGISELSRDLVGTLAVFSDNMGFPPTEGLSVLKTAENIKTDEKGLIPTLKTRLEAVERSLRAGLAVLMPLVEQLTPDAPKKVADR